MLLFIFIYKQLKQISISSYTDNIFITLIYFYSVHTFDFCHTPVPHLFSPLELHLFSCFLISKKFLGYLITFSPGQLSPSSQCSFWESSIWSLSPMEGQELQRDGLPRPSPVCHWPPVVSPMFALPPFSQTAAASMEWCLDHARTSRSKGDPAFGWPLFHSHWSQNQRMI